MDEPFTSAFAGLALAIGAAVAIFSLGCAHSDRPAPPAAQATVSTRQSAALEEPAPPTTEMTAQTSPTQAVAKVALRSTPPSGSTDALAVKGPVLLTVHARGAQIYSRPAGAGEDVPWKLKGPDAEFVSDDGVRGKHYGGPTGPTWETADGTKVVGKRVAEQDGPDVSAAPWLLIKVVSHEGNGPISAAIYIKRINTSGGKLATTFPTVGDETHVPYTADYVFYGPGSTTRP